MDSKVVIIVLNYNGKHLLNNCLISLKNQSYKNFQTWLLDNASRDKSVSYVIKKYPWVKIIKNKKNDGTAKASNVAAQKTKSKYIIFISNDIRLDKNCLKHLVKTLDDNKQVGICTSKLLRIKKDKKTKKYLIDNLGGDLDIYGFGWPRKALEINRLKSRLENIFFSYGGCFIIRRNLFNKLGGYDPKYFTLGDDIDLSWRVRLLGYQIAVNSSAFVYHKISATLKTAFPRSQKRYWSERNCLRTLLKNYETKSLLLILPKYFVLEAMEIGFWLLLQKRPKIALAIIRSFLWNLFNFSNTLKQRAKIQKMRIINDKEIIKIMLKKSLKLTKYKLFLNS